MPPVRVCCPVVAVVPAPLVVPVATVVAPFLILTSNWSAATTRLATDFVSVSLGGVEPLVNVQLITSPKAGVTLNEVPVPLGSVVLEPLFVLEHEIELRYTLIAETEPAAMVSVRV